MGLANWRAMNQAPSSPRASSGRVMAASTRCERLACRSCWFASRCARPPSVSCIAARLIQICRLPTRWTAAAPTPAWMGVCKVNGPKEECCRFGLLPLNSTWPFASSTSTRSMSRSSSSRSAIVATAAGFTANGTLAGFGVAAVAAIIEAAILLRLTARCSRSASSFWPTIWYVSWFTSAASMRCS